MRTLQLIKDTETFSDIRLSLDKNARINWFIIFADEKHHFSTAFSHDRLYNMRNDNILDFFPAKKHAFHRQFTIEFSNGTDRISYDFDFVSFYKALRIFNPLMTSVLHMPPFFESDRKARHWKNIIYIGMCTRGWLIWDDLICLNARSLRDNWIQINKSFFYVIARLTL